MSNPFRKKTKELTKSFISVAVFASVVVNASAYTWTGGGASKSWNDADNWLDRKIGIPAPMAEFIFDGAQGVGAGFGGNPTRFTNVLLTTNSASVLLKAPLFRLGARVNEEPQTGFIMEDSKNPASIRVESPSAFTLSGPVDLLTETTVNVTNPAGSVVFSGDVSGAKLVKKGAGSVCFKNGSFLGEMPSIQGGIVELERYPIALDVAEFPHGDKEPIAWHLLGGSKLTLTKGDDWVVFRCAFELGSAKTTGDTGSIEGRGANFTFADSLPSLTPGSSIICGGKIFFAPSNAQTPPTMSIGAGSVIEANSVVFGGGQRKRIWGREETPLSNMVVRLNGGTIRAVNGNIAFGGGWDNRRSFGVVCDASDGAIISATGDVSIPGGTSASNCNRLTLDKSSTLKCETLSVGTSSVSNRLRIAGAAVNVGSGGIRVAQGGSWNTGTPAFNRVEIIDGARVTSQGNLLLGRGPRGDHSKWPDAHYAARTNSILVCGGSILKTAIGVVGDGDTPYDTSDANVMTLRDANTVWDLGETDIWIGRCLHSSVKNSALRVLSGAAVKNVRNITIGYAVEWSGRTLANKLLVQGGSIESTGEVRVGDSGRNASGNPCSISNSVVVAGAGAMPGVWNFGGGALYVGTGRTFGITIYENEFSLRPGGRIRGLGSLQIGGGNVRNCDEGNRFCLAGGVIEPIGKLILGEKNTISITVNPKFGKYGTNPLMVSGDVSFGSPCYIDPVAQGVKPGQYPVMMWKGQATGLDGLALSPNADSKWKLVKDAEKKQIYLTFGK